MCIRIENNPGSFPGLIPCLAFFEDPPAPPHHEMDQEDALILEMKPKLFSMRLHFKDADL